MVKIYINGKEVPKEKLRDIKIQKESVKRMFAKKLASINAENKAIDQ